MATKKNDDGKTPITLGDKTYTMVPSMAVKKAISRQFGGLRAALDKLQMLDLDGVALLIAVGAGIDGKRERAALVDAVYEAEDIAEVVSAAGEFLGHIFAYRKADDSGN